DGMKLGGSMKKSVLLLVGTASLLIAGSAHAQDNSAGSWGLSGDIGVVSDYQYRGYSLSGSDPAVQGGLTVTSPGGYYATVWGSEIEETGIGADGDGAQVEVDLTLGRTFSSHGWDWDVAVVRYGYPDGSGLDYFEVPLSAAHTRGAVTTTLGAAYAPKQNNLGDEDNLYLYVGGAYAPSHWPVSVNAQVGHEQGAFADGKMDWQLCLSKDVGPVSLTLLYSDSDGPGSESSLVGGISIGF
ncbi:MAG: TorF family putative porin, partial [Caulobacter sp.]